MKKLQLKDLTPDLLKEMMACENAEAVVEFCKSKGLEIGPKGAEKILKQIGEAEGLSAEDLERVAGGFCEDEERTSPGFMEITYEES